MNAFSSIVKPLSKPPGALRSPAARWGVNLLAIAGAALLIWSGWIHLKLWGDGYKDISVIGPLFLIQGIVSIIIALAVGIFRWLGLLAAGAITLAATAVGLLLSVYIGLFGFTESLQVPYATLSLYEEFGGAAILLVAAAILAIAPTRAREQSPAARGTYV